MADLLQKYGNNFVRNLRNTLEGMTLEKYVRLVAVVGAYLLLRPYIMKLGAKIQAKQHEKEIDLQEGDGPKAKVSPNMLRGHGGKEVELADSESEDEGEATGVNWGKKARQRQRQHDKKLLAAIEERHRQLQEDDEDKDIMEYLVDYEEGKDGW